MELLLFHFRSKIVLLLHFFIRLKIVRLYVILKDKETEEGYSDFTLFFDRLIILNRSTTSIMQIWQVHPRDRALLRRSAPSGWKSEDFAIILWRGSKLRTVWIKWGGNAGTHIAASYGCSVTYCGMLIDVRCVGGPTPCKSEVREETGKNSKVLSKFANPPATRESFHNSRSYLFIFLIYYPNDKHNERHL